MHHFSLTIPSISCIVCINTIKEHLLNTFKDLEIVNLDAQHKILEIKFHTNTDTTIESIIKEIENIGHEIDLDSRIIHQTINSINITTDLVSKTPNEKFQQSELPKRPTPQQSNATKSTKELTEKHYLYKFLASISLGLPLLVISAFGITLPLSVMWIIASLSLGVMVYAGKDIFHKGINGFFYTGKPNTDTLFSLSTIAAFTISFAALFFPTLPFEFASALLIFSSRHIGKYIESKMKQRVSNNLDLKDNFPNKVVKIITCNVTGKKSYQTISTNEIKIGDNLFLQKGDYLPADGTLISEYGQIFKTFINGNLLADIETKGACVYAGTQVAEDKICFEVTKTLEQTYYATWEDRLKQSQQEQSNTKVGKFSKTLISYFIPGVIASAGLTLAIALPLFGPMIALHSVMAILVGACPCTLGFITPLAMRVGLDKSAKHGAAVYNKDVIEIASSIKTLVIDLNGTITQGKPEVDSVSLYLNAPIHQQIWQIIQALEYKVSKEHLIGKALKTYAKKNSLSKNLATVTEFVENQFSGIKGCIEKDVYHLGNECLLRDLNITFSNTVPNRQYLIKNNNIIAHFDIIDPIHKDTVATINQLQSQGIEVILCTGASEKTAMSYAKQLNLKIYKSDCRGDEKAEYIKLLKQKGAVAMVGDAINDVIALNTADIGIAVADADQYSKAAASVVINQQGLKSVAHFFKNSRDTMAILKQNLIFSLLYNLGVMGLTMCVALCIGSMAPAIMALSMGLQSLLILANTYRLSTLSLADTMDVSITEQSLSDHPHENEDKNELNTELSPPQTYQQEAGSHYSFWSCLATMPILFTPKEKTNSCCNSAKL